MPAQKASHRIVKRSKPAARASAKRRPAKRAVTPKSIETPDALLIAAFAEALGEHAPHKPRRAGRRSLKDALSKGASGDLIGVMPGARVEVRDVDPVSRFPHVSASKPERWSALRVASSWAIAMVVTAGIVSAAAFGVASQAPTRSIQTIAAATPAQF